MADVFSPAKRSSVMSRIRSKGNLETEIAVVQLFRRYKITGWRRNSSLLGRPDFVFSARRIALFVDGCFWHGCPYHGTTPKTNRSYWVPKLQRNSLRDKAVNRQLRKDGWRVIRVWQHELNPKRPEKLSRSLTRLLRILSSN